MTQDSECLTRVIDFMRRREAVGLVKYGTSMDRTDLTPLQWIVHAQEEAADLILYLERMKDAYLR
jgi:hypothetical protein